MTKGLSARPSALQLERWLRRRERDEYTCDRLCFLIEELNALGDSLRFARETSDERGLARAQARCGELLACLGWEPQRSVLSATWQFAERRLRQPEDVWGPALILARFEPDQQRVARWMASLQPESAALCAGARTDC